MAFGRSSGYGGHRGHWVWVQLLSVRLVIHHGSFRSFAALHQESGRLARDGKPGISRVISSAKSRAEALHIDSSFVEPNVWITDTENCRRHNFHLAVDGQSQRCNLIPTTQSCDNCVRQSRAVSLEPPHHCRCLGCERQCSPPS